MNKKTVAFQLAGKMPNIVGFCLDDFFNVDYRLTVGELRELKARMDSLDRDLTLSMVLYSHELELDAIEESIDCVDQVLFWTWHAADLVMLEENFARYRERIPDKSTLLGIYMWDFGNSQPIPMELMKLQLDFALGKFRSGEIDGMIFHCTPLVNLGLESVEYSKKWIATHGDEIKKQRKR